MLLRTWLKVPMPVSPNYKTPDPEARRLVLALVTAELARDQGAWRYAWNTALSERPMRTLFMYATAWCAALIRERCSDDPEKIQRFLNTTGKAWADNGDEAHA